MLKVKIFFTIVIFFSIYGSLAHSHANEIDSLLDDSSRAFEEETIEDGLMLLDKASYIAETQKDVKACLKIGLIYAKLPEETEKKEIAISILSKGAELAIAQKNWSILGKFALALQKLGEKDRALQIYDQMFLAAGELKNKNTFAVLKIRYEEIGDLERAGLCSEMIEALTIPPPSGWQPYGESVRGAKKVSNVSRQYQRKIADQQVQATMEYLIEKKKLEEQKKKKPLPGYRPQ